MAASRARPCDAVALRVVYEVAQSVHVPVIGIGGFATLDDALDMLAAGAVAVGVAWRRWPTRCCPSAWRTSSPTPAGRAASRRGGLVGTALPGGRPRRARAARSTRADAAPAPGWWLLAINVATAAAYAWDKPGRARGGRRTRERTLSAQPAGRVVGAWIGLFGLRHKTRHRSFWLVQSVAPSPG